MTDLPTEVPDAQIEVPDPKTEVHDLKSGGVRLNLTPAPESEFQTILDSNAASDDRGGGEVKDVRLQSDRHRHKRRHSINTRFTGQMPRPGAQPAVSNQPPNVSTMRYTSGV